MAVNTNLTADLILKESFRVLRNNIPFTNSLKPQYDNTYSAYGAKGGESIRIQKPMEYSVRTGKNIDVQANIEEAVTLTRSTMTGVDLKFSSAELTQDISEISARYIAPAVNVLAADLEYRNLLAAYKAVGSSIVLPVTSLDRADILAAGVKLDHMSTPRDNMRRVILNPKGQADVVTDLVGLFQDSSKIAAQYRDGTMGQGLGFTFGMSQGVATMTTGDRASYVTNGAVADGVSTMTVGTGTGAISLGESFTIADVYAVNPLTKQSTGQLMNFTTTTAYSATTTTITFDPPLIASGPRQNVNAAGLTAKAVTFNGTASTAYPQNLAYHPNAFAFGTMDLEMPEGVGFKARKVEDGISMRLISQYDIKTDDTYFRLDLLSGFVAVQPRFATRIYGV